MHAALRVTLRHFLVHDAAAGGHPLHVAGAEGAFVAEAVAVVDRAVEHVGDRLDAAMRMPGKAGEVVLRTIVAEIVEQQKRIGLGGVAEAEGAAQAHAGPFHGRLRLHHAFDGANGHQDCLSYAASAVWRAKRRAKAAKLSMKPLRKSRTLSSVTLPSASISSGLN